jgi:uncharacterized protein (DUF433 family)
MENLLERIERNPKVMFGKPVIKNTRLTVELVLEKLGYGASEKELLESYPFLTHEDIQACILYASRVVSMEDFLDAA